MRTTIDIPENLLRLAKAQAALKGIRLKDFVSEAIQLALVEKTDTQNSISSTQNRGQVDQVQLGDKCSFPIIRGDCGIAMQDITLEKIHHILESEDIERALYPSGR